MAGMMDVPLDAWLMIDRATGVARDVPVVTYLSNGDVRRGSYGQLADRAQRLMGALDGLRLPSRAVIGTLAPNTERHLEAHLGITGSDRVLHTLNPRSSSDDLAHVIRTAGDEAIVVDVDFLPLLRSIPEALSAVRHLIVQAEERPSVEADGLPPLVWYEDLLREQAPVHSRPSIDERSPMWICFTSGSTGRPKGVVYTHRSAMFQALVAATGAGASLGPMDCVCYQIPLSHSTFLPHAATLVGAKQVLFSGGFDPARFVDMLRVERVTVSAGVPTVWQDVLGSIESTGLLLPSLRHVLVGGVVPPERLIRGFRERGVRVIQGWGMTEVSSMAAVAWPRHGSTEAGSEPDAQATGLPMPGTALSVRDDDGVELPQDGSAVGDIWARGPAVLAGYLGDERPDDFRDGWFRTGDLGTVSPAGYLTLTDRRGDLIKSGGEWISPGAMERVLRRMDVVADVAVLAAADERWGERPLPVIVPVDGCRPPTAGVRAALSEAGFPAWQLPAGIEIVDALPRTAAGKVDKPELKRRHAASPARGG